MLPGKIKMGIVRMCKVRVYKCKKQMHTVLCFITLYA